MHVAARAERRRLRDAGHSAVPERDPAHRQWLLDRLRKQIRERRYAHRRAGQRLTDWMEHGHYNAIRFLRGHGRRGAPEAVCDRARRRPTAGTWWSRPRRGSPR